MSKTSTRSTILFSLLLLLFAVQGKAQKTAPDGYDPNKIYWWGGLTLGGGTYTFNSGFNANLLLRNKFLISFKADGNINADFLDYNHENIEADEYNLLFGIKLTDRPYSNWIASVGLSSVQITQRGDYIGYNSSYLFAFAASPYGDNKVYNTIGVPIALNYMLTPTRFFAMDFGASANLNGQRSFVALTFGVAFGHVRAGAPKAPPFVQ